MPHTFTHTYMQRPTRISGEYAHTYQDFYKNMCRNTQVHSHTYITHRSDDCRGHEGSQPDAPLETVNELNEGGKGGGREGVLGG